MRLALVCSVAAVASLAACASGPETRGERLVDAPMTREEILTWGTHRFSAEPTDVFRAALSALQTLGYPIVTEEQSQGLIVTGRKLVRVVPLFTFGYGPATATHTRQLIVRLFEDNKTGEVVVSALPKRFENDEDVSERAVWDLPSERQMWRALFAQMDALLLRH